MSSRPSSPGEDGPERNVKRSPPAATLAVGSSGAASSQLSASILWHAKLSHPVRRPARSSKFCYCGRFPNTHNLKRITLPARQRPGELAYCLSMLLVPDLGNVPGDLEQRALVRQDRPRTFLPDT